MPPERMKPISTAPASAPLTEPRASKPNHQAIKSVAARKASLQASLLNLEHQGARQATFRQCQPSRPEGAERGDI